jgi:hypothetical protein
MATTGRARPRSSRVSAASIAASFVVAMVWIRAAVSAGPRHCAPSSGACARRASAKLRSGAFEGIMDDVKHTRVTSDLPRCHAPDATSEGSAGAVRGQRVTGGRSSPDPTSAGC